MPACAAENKSVIRPVGLGNAFIVFHNVITSYSIHYTKLYERLRSELSDTERTQAEAWAEQFAARPVTEPDLQAIQDSLFGQLVGD